MPPTRKRGKRQKQTTKKTRKADDNKREGTEKGNRDPTSQKKRKRTEAGARYIETEARHASDKDEEEDEEEQFTDQGTDG